MDFVLNGPQSGGEITVHSSKSGIHRALICSALSNSRTFIRCNCDSDDNKITAEVLNALGATIRTEKTGFDVHPISGLKNGAVLNCGNSASTLRFFLPVVAALGTQCTFYLSKELASRPIDDLCNALLSHGATAVLDPKSGGSGISGIMGIRQGVPLYLSGGLFPGDYAISGSISSQFASGLIIALSMLGGTLEIKDGLENRFYLQGTVEALRSFGADITSSGNVYYVRKTFPFISKGEYVIDGDWTEAALYLCAGAIGNCPVKVNGLDFNSNQGSRAVVTILRAMGARVETYDDCAIAYPSELHGVEINMKSCPDIVPVICVTACKAKGKSIFHGISNVNLRESDRSQIIAEMICSLGGSIRLDDGLIEVASSSLKGGTVNTHGDHRIAMSAAIAAIICSGKVIIKDADCVSKSRANFWNDLKKIMK